MTEACVAHSRAPQILFLLHEHGPLSTKGLESLIRPRIAKRRLQDALLRLYQKGLVIRRFEASPFSRQYYELSQSDEIRQEINRLTGISTQRLIQPYFRSQELLHSEECAFWAEYLKTIFPDADVVRDFKLKEHADIMNHLIFDEKDGHLLPDIVLYFPRNDAHEAVAIPVELELSRKANNRLYAKIKKYSNLSRADGLIYLCHKNTLIDTVKSIYGKSFASSGSGTYLLHASNLFCLNLKT